jgi:hypothetical protein
MYSFTCSLCIFCLLFAAGVDASAHGQDAAGPEKERSLEAVLSLKPLDSALLFVDVPKPRANIRIPAWRQFMSHLNGRVWSQFSDTASGTEASSIDIEAPISDRYKTGGKWRLAPELAKMYTDGVDEIVFHATIDSPNGLMYLATVEAPPKSMGRKQVAGVIFDETRKRAAQLRVYEEHPEVLEIRFFAGVLRHEVLTPTARRGGRTPREYVDVSQVAPTLILKSDRFKPDEETASTQPSVPAVMSGKDGVGNPMLLPPAGTFALRLEADSFIEIGALSNIAPPVTVEVLVRSNRDQLGRALFSFNGNQLLVDVSEADAEEGHQRYTSGRVVRLKHDQIYHVCQTWDGNLVRTFLNGAPAGSYRYRARGAVEHAVAIGSNLPKRKSAACDVLSARISRTLRYPNAFEPPDALPVDQQTTAAFWLTEGEGAFLGDVSGNGHHGSIHQAEWVSLSE